MSRVIGVLLLTLASTGCIEASDPAPPARTPVGWEQWCRQVYDVAQADALASWSGTAGWELVALYNGVMCFKRPAAAGAHRSPIGGLPAVRDPGF